MHSASRSYRGMVSLLLHGTADNVASCSRRVMQRNKCCLAESCNYATQISVAPHPPSYLSYPRQVVSGSSSKAFNLGSFHERSGRPDLCRRPSYTYPSCVSDVLCQLRRPTPFRSFLPRKRIFLATGCRVTADEKSWLLV